MTRTCTFGQKLGAGMTLVIVLVAALGAIALLSLQSVVEQNNQVVKLNARNLIDAWKVHTLLERFVAEDRGYLLTGDEHYLRDMETRRAEFKAKMTVIKKRDLRDLDTLIKLEEISSRQHTAVSQVLTAEWSQEAIPELVAAFRREVLPETEALELVLDQYMAGEEEELAEGMAAAKIQASRSTSIVLGIMALVVVLVIAIAVLLTRTLNRQIGAAVQHVRSSSTELQASANQQASGAREQVTAVGEVTTTVSELLATSRQIAQSAQRVAAIAQDTATAGHDGGEIVDRAQAAVQAIRGQIEVVVTHMLDLGKKSQQIGTVLEIINELAEQTNILAINAGIEAAGAGESGRRFAVVGEEIASWPTASAAPPARSAGSSRRSARR